MVPLPLFPHEYRVFALIEREQGAPLLDKTPHDALLVWTLHHLLSEIGN